MDVNLALFVGRFHPLIIHLPIALVMVLALVESVAVLRRQPLPPFWLRLFLGLSTASAIAGVACGWLLASGGGYDPVLLERHRWLGTAVAGLCVLALVLHLAGTVAGYRLALLATVATLGAASHIGGSITHGTTYLTEHAPEPLRTLMGGEPPVPPRPAIEDPLQADLVLDVVQPILTKGCADCHGPGKQQGDLRLDSIAAVLKGGTNGPSVVPGDPAHSELLRRLALPESDPKRMPPAGRPGLAFEDVELLRWWIAAGAKDQGTVGPLNPPGNVLAILGDRFHPKTPATTLTVDEARTLAKRLGDELAIEVRITEVAKQPEATVNASVVASFSDAQLARLAPLAPVIRDLRLGSTKITAAGLEQLGTLRQVRNLDLSRTAIDDTIAPRLAGLYQLESLNLYGTKVGDGLLPSLQRLPRLRRVYLWQTAVTPKAASDFAQAQTDQRRIDDLHRRIDDLQREARRAKADVDLGTPVATVAAPESKPTAAATATNTVCPVSGKPVDPAITRTVDGVTIAYCCPKCPPKTAKK